MNDSYPGNSVHVCETLLLNTTFFTRILTILVTYILTVKVQCFCEEEEKVYSSHEEAG